MNRRQGATAVAVLAGTLGLVAARAAAVQPPLWLKPSRTSNAARVPRVDGVLDIDVLAGRYEYANGRKLRLNNWKGNGQENGDLYLQVQDSEITCVGGACVTPRYLYIGLKLPRKLNAGQTPSGLDEGNHLTLYVDGDRVPLLSVMTSADRTIAVDFTQANAIAAPSGPVTWTVDEATPEYHRQVAIKGYETYYFVEISLELPAENFNASSPPDLETGLGIHYRDLGYAEIPNENTVFTLPNKYERANPASGYALSSDKTTWESIELGMPQTSRLGVGIWNVGQMVHAGVNSVPGALGFFSMPNGGAGTPGTIGKSIFTRNLVCLTEVYDKDDRKEIEEVANRNREINKLRRFQSYYVQSDDKILSFQGESEPPNNMILTDWIIEDADYVLYRNIDVTSNRIAEGLQSYPNPHDCSGPDDNVAGIERGAKGILWVRIAAPLCSTTGQPPDEVTGTCLGQDAPLVGSKTERFDVFCTHNQAQSDPLDAANPLYDTSSDPEERNGHIRECQAIALSRYVEDKRMKDRPALLLGDLNQAGPRRLPDNTMVNGSNEKLSAWMASSADVYQPANVTTVKQNYQKMREALGNWNARVFDVLNQVHLGIITGYDVTGDTHGFGTWIGQDDSASTSAKRVDECTPGTPDMTRVPRIDYIMVLPPRDPSQRPVFGFTWDPAQDWSTVDKHLSSSNCGALTTGGVPVGNVGVPPGTSDPQKYASSANVCVLGSACQSDHAEAVAYLRTVPLGFPGSWNPTKDHYLKVNISRLDDVHDDDGGDTDWMVKPDNKMVLYKAGCNLNQCRTAAESSVCCQGDSWNSDTTPSGTEQDPNWVLWSNGWTFGGSDVVYSALTVYDDDDVDEDLYDANPGQPCATSTYKLEHSTGHITFESPPPCGAFAAYGPPAMEDFTEGSFVMGRVVVDGTPKDTGDRQVEITTQFSACERDPFDCKDAASTWLKW